MNEASLASPCDSASARTLPARLHHHRPHHSRHSDGLSFQHGHHRPLTVLLRDRSNADSSPDAAAAADAAFAFRSPQLSRTTPPPNWPSPRLHRVLAWRASPTSPLKSLEGSHHRVRHRRSQPPPAIPRAHVTPVSRASLPVAPPPIQEPAVLPPQQPPSPGDVRAPAVPNDTQAHPPPVNLSAPSPPPARRSPSPPPLSRGLATDTAIPVAPASLSLPLPPSPPTALLTAALPANGGISSAFPRPLPPGAVVRAAPRPPSPASAAATPSGADACPAAHTSASNIIRDAQVPPLHSSSPASVSALHWPVCDCNNRSNSGARLSPADLRLLEHGNGRGAQEFVGVVKPDEPGWCRRAPERDSSMRDDRRVVAGGDAAWHLRCSGCGRLMRCPCHSSSQVQPSPSPPPLPQPSVSPASAPIRHTCPTPPSASPGLRRARGAGPVPPPPLPPPPPPRVHPPPWMATASDGSDDTSGCEGEDDAAGDPLSRSLRAAIADYHAALRRHEARLCGTHAVAKGTPAGVRSRRGRQSSDSPSPGYVGATWAAPPYAAPSRTGTVDLSHSDGRALFEGGGGDRSNDSAALLAGAAVVPTKAVGGTRADVEVPALMSIQTTTTVTSSPQPRPPPRRGR